MESLIQIGSYLPHNPYQNIVDVIIVVVIFIIIIIIIITYYYYLFFNKI